MFNHRLEMAALAGLSLFAGMLFFTLLRPQGIGLHFFFPGLPAPAAWLPPVFLGSFPSFIHSLAHTFTCFAVLACSRAVYLATSMLLLATTVACEFITGVFDPVDIIAATAGTTLAMLIVELRVRAFSGKTVQSLPSPSSAST